MSQRSLALSNLKEAISKARYLAFHYKKWKKLDALAIPFAKELAKAFVAQGRYIALEFVRRYSTLMPNPIREAFDPNSNTWLSLFSGIPSAPGVMFEMVFSQFLNEAFVMGEQDMLRLYRDSGSFKDGQIPLIGVDIQEAASREAMSYLNKYVGRLITKIDDETRKKISKILVAGAKRGAGYSELANMIIQEFSEMARNTAPQKHIRTRAEFIAITELGQAYEAGTESVNMKLFKLGLDIEKFWLTVGDSRVSRGCRVNAAAGWITADQLFPSGHSRPLRFPGCRCSALWQIKGDE